MVLQGPAFSSALATHCSAQMSPPACLDLAGAQSRIRGCSSREREESKYCRKGQRPFAFSDQASLSNCLPRPCHPSGSSGCCFCEPILAPSHRMLLMPELSNQLCSSCEHGSALLQIDRVFPATWETATESSQSLVFAWHALVLLSCFSSQKAVARARLRGNGGFYKVQETAR